MKPRPAAIPDGADPEATAELPLPEVTTDVYPVPALAVAPAELGDRLRELEQQLLSTEQRIQELEAAVAAGAMREAALVARLEEVRRETQAQLQSQRASESRAAAARHQHEDFTELRQRCERQFEALATWHGFRAVTAALLDDADARNLALEAQLEALRVAPRPPPADNAPALPPPGPRAEVEVARVRRLVRRQGAMDVVYPVGRRTTIGRTPDNDIQIDVQNVSRHHAVLLANAGQCVIEDLNSTNGVQVNGHRTQRQVLHDGDIVTIGKTEFRFQQRS